MFGNYGEVSEATHKLLDTMATNRVRVAGPQTDRRGIMRSEEGEKALAVSYIRRRVSLAAAAGRKREAQVQDGAGGEWRGRQCS